MENILFQLIQGGLTVLAGVFFIWLAKKIDDKRTRDFNDDKQIDDGNLAVGLRRGGLYLAIAIAFTGSLGGQFGGFFIDLLQFILDGSIILVALFVSRSINDRIMMAHLANDAEFIKEFQTPGGKIQMGNTALGFVEAGMFIATGFILRGSMIGGGGSFFQSMASTLLFFILGQATLLFFGWLYELFTRFDVRQEIQKNNMAAGIGLGGMLSALGIILSASIAGPFTGWASDIISYFVYATYGMAMLLIFRFIVDRLLLPTTDLLTEIQTDQNTAALVVVEGAILAVALLIAASA